MFIPSQSVTRNIYEHSKYVQTVDVDQSCWSVGLLTFRQDPPEKIQKNLKSEAEPNIVGHMH